jgi:hypothetical protein
MLDKSHTRLMTFLNTREINSMLDYDKLDIGMLDMTACHKNMTILRQFSMGGCLILKSLSKRDLFTLSIRHPIPNIDHKKFIRSYMNCNHGTVFTTLYFLRNS